ncbi:UNVERIFIED_CONTAM: hypothetical protein ABIC26_001144 [Paenibacillus sp. PvR008]
MKFFIFNGKIKKTMLLVPLLAMTVFPCLTGAEGVSNQELAKPASVSDDTYKATEIGKYGVESEVLDSKTFIDPHITGTDRAIILDVMKDIPAEERTNVVYIRDDGEIFANKPELLKQWSNAEQIGENLFKTKEGQTIAAPKQTCDLTQSFSTQNVSCAPSDGPYRKVQSNTGYSWFSGYVYLPSQNKGQMHDENKPGGNGDTAHIYAGGIAANEVDAGFFHQPTNDNWAMFIRQNGYSYGPLFESGQNIFLKFYVPTSDKVALYAAGSIVGSSQKDTTVVRDVRGWNTSGYNQSIKRSTTIASKVGSPHSGSFINGVHWYNSYIGTSSTNNSPWTRSSQTAGYCNVPSSQVTASFINSGEETVNIRVP